MDDKTIMANQDKIQSVLQNSRWASRFVASKDSEIRVQLISFPGVVGGVFHAHITGLTADYFGHADVSMTCTGCDSDYIIGQPRQHSYGTDFQEHESLLIDAFSFEVSFRIPYDTQATEEGSDWHLSIDFANGVSEVFAIPVCRTVDSDPEMTSVQIAADGLIQNKDQQRLSSQNTINDRVKPYTMTNSNGELSFRFPARTPARKTVLARGLGIFAGLWAVMVVSVLWFSKQPPLDLIFVFGGLLLIMLIIILFLLFGISNCKINEKNITAKHKLFGLPINWTKVNREDLAGFSTKSLGLTSGQAKTQSNYFVIAVIKPDPKTKQDVKQKKNSYRFLCVTAFDQYQARLLAKKLNDYWAIGQ
ncbi:hypothetical protein N9060_01215 [Arenicella sp.]|nr:hypothetical protein [Arenicella sp.]